jgi:hypothetical protein
VAGGGLNVSLVSALPGLDAATYRRHALHGEDQVWVEKNCYVDLWIEVLHALGHEPLAMLPFTIPIDFEGDQWTFYKPSHEELRELYGVEVQELTVWKPLLEHTLEHVAARKLVSTEADAYWLPDTLGTDYRQKHSKTTIVIAAIDAGQKRIDYFHNAGYFSLQGDDFDRIFGLAAAPAPDFLPLYAEFIRFDRQFHSSETEQAARCRRLLTRHAARCPPTDPIAAFEKRLLEDLPVAQERGLDYYHAWAFATIRQLGSAAELAARSLRWLGAHGPDDFSPEAAHFERIATINKALILKVARAVNSRRPLDVAASFQEMSAARAAAVASIRARTSTDDASSERR